MLVKNKNGFGEEKKEDVLVLNVGDKNKNVNTIHCTSYSEY